jgi:plasmid stabilization system protein ParE
MDYAIVWTEPALIDFEAIVRFLFERNPQAAEALRVSILDHVDLLSRFPFIGPVYEQDRTGRAREIICGQYRIFYRVDEAEKRVEILTVWHRSRSEPTLYE